MLSGSCGISISLFCWLVGYIFCLLQTFAVLIVHVSTACGIVVRLTAHFTGLSEGQNTVTKSFGVDGVLLGLGGEESDHRAFFAALDAADVESEPPIHRCHTSRSRTPALRRSFCTSSLAL